MAAQVYQCCYTNTGQDRKGGWRPVAVIGTVPEKALQTCVQVQSAAAASQARRAGGFYQFLCDGAFAYIIHTQCGLTDTLGRSNVFSHGFIFPAGFSPDNGQSVLKDPVFLSLSRENFRESEADALQWDGTYETLSRTPMNLAEARHAAGLDDTESYRTLIHCVYARMVRNGAFTPLYVQYDGTEEQMRALLYCIWSGLPFFLRRQFSAASTPALGGAQFYVALVRSVKQRGKDVWYPGLKEQDAGILTPRIRSRLKYFGYLDYAVGLPSEQISGFYEALDTDAAAYGDGTDETILKLLFLKKRYQTPAAFPDDDLTDWLSDALGMDSYGGLEEYIAGMVKELDKRRLTLPDWAEQDMIRWTRAHPAKTFHQKEAERREAWKQEKEKKIQEATASKVSDIKSEIAAANRAYLEEDEARRNQWNREEEAKQAKWNQEQEAKQARWNPIQEVTQRATGTGLSRYRVFTPRGDMTDRENRHSISQDIQNVQATIESVKAVIEKKQRDNELTIESLHKLWDSMLQLNGSHHARRLFLKSGWTLYLNAVRSRKNAKDAEIYEEYKSYAESVWDAPHDALFDAQLAYWDLENWPLPAIQRPQREDYFPGSAIPRMSFEVFSFDKTDFYRDMQSEDTKHSNGNLFLDFVRLGESCRTEPEKGEYLKKTDEFFQSHWDIPDASRRAAVRELGNYLSGHNQDGHKLVWFQSWLSLMIEFPKTAGENIADNIVNLHNWFYSALSKRHFAEECYRDFQTLQNFWQTFQERDKREKYRKLLIDTLESACREYEDQSHGTPLDMWLLLGEAMHGKRSCFSVFDKSGGTAGAPGQDARILRRPPREVADESWLLKNNVDKDYLDCAGRYNGGNVKAVHDWYKAAK